MWLGALVDAGAPVEAIQEAIFALPVEPVTLAVSTVTRHGLGATRVEVRAPDSPVRRTWASVRALLEEADLPSPVAATALATFERLANAEAEVHRTTPEKVHFHEVGALDAIADVVGTAAGLHALGVERLSASTVGLGSGVARGEHGVVPVPGPAVLALLGAAGAPVQGGPAPYEMCTPTGAALLAATVRQWGPLPPMRVAAVGTGAGGRDVAEVPNVLRIVLGEPVPAADPAGFAGFGGDGGGPDAAVVLATNVDDLDPRLWPDVLARLLDVGASDAWLTPILMKKGRPAHELQVLCPPDAVEPVLEAVFTLTSTIGLRESRVVKHTLDRVLTAVDVAGQRVGVKVARLSGRVVNVSVEFDDVRRAAEALGWAPKEVLRVATAQTAQIGRLGSARGE